MSPDLLSLEALRGLTPSQAAARWIASEDHDEALFEQWIGANEENRAAWRKARMVWGLFDEAEEDAMIVAMARAARQAGPAEAIEEEHAPLREAANDRTWPKLLVAAAAVLMLASTVIFGLQGRWFGGSIPSTEVASVDMGDPFGRFGKADYQTGRGQKSIIELRDGTRVTLGPDSAIDVAFADGHRNLRLLRGQGYFDVAHDPAHPFAVQAAGRVVTALGTRFDVNMMSNTVRVVLAQGSVSVASAPGSGSAQAPVLLRPGQAFTATGDRGGRVSDTDLDQDLAWREGFAAFDNRPLSEVIETLNRSTRAQVFTRDPKVAAMRVTGQFRTGDIERFGRALSLVLPVRVVARGPDRYEVVSRR